MIRETFPIAALFFLVFSIPFFIFIKDNRKPVQKSKLEFASIGIKRVAKTNDLPTDISTYWARHSFASNSIRKGASMEFISEALNHSDLSVTKSYFAGFEDETKKEFANQIMDF